MRFISVYITLAIILFVPQAVFAVASGHGGLVPCDGVKTECDFGKLIQLAHNVLNFIVTMATMLSALMFAYAGWLYLSSAGNQENVKKAHKLFYKVVLGMVIILIAWVLIDTVLKSLTDKGLKDRQEDLHAEMVDMSLRIG